MSERNLTDKEILQLGSKQLETRSELMKELCKAVADPNCPIIANVDYSQWSGPAGVGKTFPGKPDITITGSSPELEAMLDAADAQRDEELLDIAKEHLHLKTLKTRNSDELDFSEVAVWSVKAALAAAYLAGAESAE
jgi:hypothetical protein